MNAPATIPAEIAEAANVLRVMREAALTNAAIYRGMWVGDLGALIADVANHMMFADMPLVAIDDTKKAIQHLQRAQRILGHLEGVYPTDRYKGAPQP